MAESVTTVALSAIACLIYSPAIERETPAYQPEIRLQPRAQTIDAAPLLCFFDRIRDQIDRYNLLLRTSGNRHDIDPPGGLGGEITAFEEGAGEFSQTCTLGARDRFGSHPWISATPCAHFDEDQHAIVTRHKVDFAGGAAPLPHQNLIAATLQITRRDCFAPITKASAPLSHTISRVDAADARRFRHPAYGKQVCSSSHMDTAFMGDAQHLIERADHDPLELRIDFALSPKELL